MKRMLCWLFGHRLGRWTGRYAGYIYVPRMHVLSHEAECARCGGLFRAAFVLGEMRQDEIPEGLR